MSNARKKLLLYRKKLESINIKKKTLSSTRIMIVITFNKDYGNGKRKIMTCNITRQTR